ncbi:MAG: MoaD/ThiS family protein [Candidatus Bathyarchaeia archaeon]|jgi:MoaD family protein
MGNRWNHYSQIYAKGTSDLKVTVKFLAAAREKAGVREETLQLEGATTVLEILKALAARHGDKLKEYLFDPESGNPRPHLQFLLNGRSVSMMGGFSAEVTEDATMMIFPPTSGG